MQNQNESHLGHLVTQLGWIPDDKLEKLVAISNESGQPLGRILLQHSYISPDELRNLIEAQALIRDDHISLAYAKRALAFSSWNRVPLENALPWVVPGDIISKINHSKRLGQLLFASGCVDLSTLEHTLTISKQVGIQLGELLKSRDHVSENMISVSLESQRLLRSGLISEDQAVAGINKINHGLSKFKASDQRVIVPLGQLLVNSGVLTRKNVDDALEVSRINGKPLGEVLKIFALLTDGILDSALHLQSLMHTGSLKYAGATQALNQIHLSNVTIQEALAAVHDISHKNAGLKTAELIILTGLFEHRQQEIELVSNSGFSSREEQSHLTELIGADMVRTAVRLTFLVKHSILSIEQALIAFHMSLLTELDIDRFLEAVSWVDKNTFETISRNKKIAAQGTEAAA